MPYFKVMLARLVRETATVTVKAKSGEDLSERLSEVYERDKSEDQGVWESDYDWTPEEESHIIIDEIEQELRGRYIDLDKEDDEKSDWKASLPATALENEVTIYFDEYDNGHVILLAALKGAVMVFDADHDWVPVEQCDGNAVIFGSKEEASKHIVSLVKKMENK